MEAVKWAFQETTHFLQEQTHIPFQIGRDANTIQHLFNLHHMLM